MKRRGLLLALLLVLCLFARASAEGEITFTAPVLTVHRGEDVTLTVEVSGNDLAMAGCTLDILCDTDSLRPATEGDEPDLAVTLGPSFSFGNVEGHLMQDRMRVSWWSMGSAMPWNGVLFQITLHVDENAAPGVYPVTLQFDRDKGDVSDNDGHTLPAVCRSGSITVVSIYRGEEDRGDVNGDRKLDILDMDCLFTYLSQGRNGGWMETTEDLLRASDVNGDTRVDILDYQALYQKLQ